MSDSESESESDSETDSSSDVSKQNGERKHKPAARLPERVSIDMGEGNYVVNCVLSCAIVFYGKNPETSLIVFCICTNDPESLLFSQMPLVNPHIDVIVRKGWVDHISAQITHVIAF